MNDESNPAMPESNADSASALDENLNVEVELQALRNELNDANDRALRSQAELDNYRKRAQREMADERKYAALNVIGDMLSVADNLELAIQAAEKDPCAASVAAGVKMVLGQFYTILAQHQCQKIEGVGQPFDPNLHQAVMQEPSTEYPPNTVTRVMRSGYKLHDRVIRPAQVFVSATPS